MAYTGLKPADTQTIAQGPADIRSELQGLATGEVVNAGTLKGLSPGNASGQIPVSNGTLNTNLNAEKVGGKYAADFSLSTHTHPAATTSTNGLMSNTDKTKLDGIAAGAEVNQNAFSNVLVGSTTIQADAKTDTFEMVAGTNIALTPDATNDRVTIGVTGTVAAATTAGACTGNAATATTLQIPRTFGISGDVVGTATSFNGGANITIPATLAASGVAAGTYTSVTVDAKGRVTAAGNPATISANTTGNAATSSSCSGNAATATKLATARSIALTGAVTGSGSFDGSGNLTIATTGATAYIVSSGSGAGYSWRKWSDGTIEQWMQVPAVIRAAGTVTFPIPFPSACQHINFSDTGYNGANSHALRFALPTTTGVAYNWDLWGNYGQGNNITIMVYAKGY